MFTKIWQNVNSYENTQDLISDDVSELVYCESFDNLDDLREELPILKNRKYEHSNYNGFNDEIYK